MAATKISQSPADLAPAEVVEYLIVEILSSLGVAESAINRLDPDTAFDVGCALYGAREALDRALAAIAQPQPQIRSLAA
jgi:HEAT repeat protein